MKDILPIIGLIIFLAGATGYVKNIIGLTEIDGEAPYKAEIVRVVGLIPPVGAIVGYLDVGK